jgi:hypothetical protein
MPGEEGELPLVAKGRDEEGSEDFGGAGAADSGLGVKAGCKSRSFLARKKPRFGPGLWVGRGRVSRPCCGRFALSHFPERRTARKMQRHVRNTGVLRCAQNDERFMELHTQMQSALIAASSWRGD